MLLLMSGLHGVVTAQCGSNTQTGGQSGCGRSNFFRGEVLPNSGCDNFTVISNYSPGEYFRVPVLQGGCYTVSTCGAPFDTHINVFQGGSTTSPFAYNDDNGPLCTGTPASLHMTPNFTDYAMVDVRQYPCAAGGSSSITVYLRQNNNLSITSSSANMCQGQTRALTATPARVTVTPPPNSGDVGTFSGSGVSGTNFTAPTPGGNSASYTVTYSFGYCSTTQSITVFRNPSTANAGPDQTVCSTTATLAGNAATFGTGAWSIVSGPGSITTPTSPTSTVTGLVPGLPTTLRWTISNGACAASTDDVVITLNNTAPSITCPSTQSLALGGSCSAVLPNYIGMATVSGACSPTVTQSPVAGTNVSGTGSLTVSLFATNTVPQSATCTFTVNKQDNQVPAITCPGNISLNATVGTCSATATYTAPTGTDNCSGASTTRTTGLASGSSFPVGVTTNTFRVTDASSNTATCSFTVTVTDNQAPAITCPSNISSTASPCAATVTFTSPVGTDNCPIPLTIQATGIASGGSFPIGVTTNTFRVTDASGTTATCSFTVTVNAPEIGVKGNGLAITHNDLAPSTADFTDFGNVLVGANLSRTFKIYNTGNAALSITTPVTIAGAGFSIMSQPTTSIPVGDSTAIIVRFAPVSVGVVTTNLSIGNGDCNEAPYVFALTGNGLPSTHWYVDHTATGANTGFDWANAFTDFQTAVATADAGDTVFVAAGTHKPSVGPGRTKKFTLGNGVRYYGGFPNGGGTFAQRDFVANRTILSGDIGTQGDSTDNCFVVVDASNLSNATLMSGFTIERGNADSSSTTIYGRTGGIYLDNTGSMRMDSLTVRNNYGQYGAGIAMISTGNLVMRGCIVQNNNGRGLYLGGSASLTNCTFSGNRGTNGGAVSINSLPATFSFTGCTFSNNTSTGSGQGGGAIHAGNGNTTTFTNCTFTGNSAAGLAGGAVCKFAGSLSFTGCTFTQNIATTGGAIQSFSGGFNLTQCSFTQNATSGGSGHGGACNNNGGVGIYENCRFWNNTTATGLGGAIYNNTGGSLTLRQCSFNRNNAGGFSQGGGLNNNSSSNATVNNCIFWGNLANGNDAASNTEIGHGTGTLTVTNTIWQGNTSGGSIYNVDPRFADAVLGDLHLTVCSPAIDTGSTAGMPVVDLDGNTRPFNARPGGLDYDLGAYEFQSSALDVTPPVAVCANQTVTLDALGAGSTTASAVGSASTDNCGIQSMSLSQSAFTCANVGNVPVVLTVTDLTGNTATCTATITVQDVTVPIALCQNLTVFLNGSGNVTVTGAMLNGGSTDACGIGSTTPATSSYNCSVVPNNNRLIWSDAATLMKGETNGTSQQALTTAPVAPFAFQFVPSKDSIYFTDNSGGRLRRVHVNGGAVTDIKTGINPFGIAVDAAAGKIYWSDPSGNTINKCNMDGSGNQVIVSGATEADYSRFLKLDLVNNKIYWTDANLGTIKRANLDGSSLQTLVTGQGNIVGLALDVPNNKLYWTSYSFNQLRRANLDGTGQTTLVGTASLPLGVTIDHAGSKIYVACGFGTNTIQRFNLDGSGGTTVASGLNLPYEIQFLPAMSNVLTVTDVNGNTSTCTSQVTVRDSIRPTVACQNLTLNLNAGGSASTTATALSTGSSDNCSVSSLVASQTAFTCANLGSNSVTVTVTDPSANTGTCSSTVTIQDLILPTINCPGNVTQNNAPGQCGATVTYSTPVGTDNCAGSTTIRTTGQASGTLFPVGTTTNTFRVTDGAGNSATCSFTVTVNDNQAPTISCPPNTTLGNTMGTCSATYFYTTPVGSDNCPGATTMQTAGFASGGTFPLGTTPNTFRVTDAVGNTATCSFNVTVVDIQAPTITCPSAITGTNDPGFCSKVVTFTAPVGSDNCLGPATAQTVGLGSGSSFPVGVTTNTFRVIDAAGNSASCSFTVTISDGEPPTIACPGNISLNTASGQCSATANYSAPISMDNCPGATTSQTAGLGSAVSYPTGVTTNTFRVTDAAGNSATCSFTVTITDAEAPAITCPGNINLSSASGQCSATATYTTPVGTDNCAGAITTQTSGLGTGASFPVGGTTNTFLVTDASGNTATCSFMVTVTDTEAPAITCPANISTNVGSGTCDAIVTYTTPVGSDNCPGATTMQTAGLASGASFPLGVTTNAFQVTDASGLTATCSFTVTVTDATPPTAICQDITLQLDGSGNASTTAGAIDNGSTDPCGIASVTLSQGAFTCANVGANPVVLTVTDMNGNTATCSATVTVQDQVAPTATCQNITLSLDGSGNAGTTASAINNGSTDACGIASLSLNNTAFTCANVGANTVVLTVTDVNGNTSTCSATVTIQDNIAPVATCQDVTVQLDNTGNGSTTATAVNNGSSDACGIQSLALSQTAFVCSEVGANTEVLTVTDVNGNTSTCTATITVEDNVAPVAICQDVTVQLDNTGNGSTTATAVNNGSSDACGIQSLALSQTAFVCSEVGANTEVLSVTDVNGNTSTCTTTITVEDNVAPVAICQDVTVQLDNSGNGSTTATAVNNGSSDACGIQSLALSQTAFVCSEVGANTEVLTVTDVNGNTSTCTTTITVEDNVAPVAICQDVTVQLDNSGNGSTTATAVNNGSSDACGIQSLALSQTAFVCTEVGANTEVLTVTDVNGNTSTCTTTITVEDNVAPVAICQDVTVQLDNSGNGSTTATAVNNGSSDACGIQSLALSQTAFVCSEVGANTEVLTVTDVYGNTSTCTTTITVEDNVAPIAICQDVTVQLDNTGNGSTTATAVNNGSSDACGIQSLALSQTAFVCTEVGANTEVLTVTDVNGNTATCSATVTVQDLIAPMASCQNVTVSLDGSGNGSTSATAINNGSVDACGIASLTLNNSAFTCANVGPNAVLLTVMDVNGNTSTCSATVTVQDLIAPMANCQNVTLSLDGSGNGSTTASAINNGSTDACGIASLSLNNSAFTCANVGPNAVVLTVTDVNGNTSTCSATVTVQDLIAPITTCQNVTLSLDGSGNASTTASAIDNGSTDACGIASLTLNNTAFTCANVGANTVVLTVTDVNGNTATCSATVTVQDLVAPGAICQNATVNLDAGGSGSTTAAAINNGSYDACGIASLSLDLSAFTCTYVGTNTVILTVSDVNGNTATCSAAVTVQDLVAPTAICQNATVNLDAGGMGSTTATAIDNGSTDACGIASLTLNNSAFTCANVGANTVVLTVTDAHGNTATCSATVTVQDLISPAITCPANLSVNNQVGICGAPVTYTVPVGTDNCSGASTSQIGGLASGATFPVGTTTNTFRVTDASGNSSTCSFTVTVTDAQAPAISCPANVSLNNVTNTCGAVSNYTTPIGTDNCPGATTTQTAGLPSGAGFPIGTTTNTFLVSDAVGLTATCAFTVTVVDNELPQITCPANASLNAQSGICSATFSYTAPVGTDNCPGSTTMQTAGLASGASYTVGVTTNTFQVTDASGNSSTCSFTVTVIDAELPTITCPASISTTNDTGACGATLSYSAPVGSDNCAGANTMLAAGLASGASFPVGVTTNVFQVTDASGNTATCSFTVTVSDTELPAITCPANISTTAQSGVCGAAVTYTTPAGTDNCPGITTTLTSGLPSGTVFPVGTTTNAFLSTDASGNTATCSFTVTVSDVTPPTALCQDVTIQLDSLGGANGTAALVNNGSNDACGVTSVVLSINAFSCSNVGSNAVVLTATDANGNTGTCSATVTVQDLIAPIAVCANATVDLNGSGNAVMGASVIGAGSSDNCGFTAALSQGSFTCADIGVRTVTLTLTDPSGNTGSCSAMVTVRDVTPPSAVCSNATVTLNGSGQGVIGASVIGLGTSDACGAFTATISQDSFSCAHLGSNAVVFTATDASGNTSSCTAVVLVVDNTAPQAICQSVTVVLDANGQGSLSPNDVNNGSSDACGILGMGLDVTAFDCSDVGSSAVVLTVADLSGNTATCSASVTVVDTIAPIAICQNATVTLNSSGNGSLAVNQVDNGSSDVCGLGNIGLDVIAFGCAQVGTQTVTLTAADAAGNTATCTATVTVEDITPPLALCHDVTVQLDSNGAYTLTPAELNSNSNDACGIDTIALSLSNLSCSHLGSQSVTMTLTDGSGNSSSCTVVVTVEDLIAPVPDCHPATIALDSLGSITLTASDISNSTDNCAIVGNVLSVTAFTCSDLGSHAVTLTMTDGSGNTSSCAVAVTVADSTAPAALCQDLTLQLDSLGTATLLPSDLDNGSTDACGIDTMSLSRSIFTCANLGPQVVTLIVGDASGNSSTCASTVTVVPATLVVTPMAVVQSCGYHVTCPGANDGSAFVTVTGGCSPYSYAWSNGGTTDSLSGLSAGAYSVTVSDASGQSSIQNLVLVQPDAVSVTFGGDSAVCLGSLAHLVAQPFGGNACQGFNYLWSTGDTTDSISGLSAGMYTVTVTDAFGCSGIDSVNVNTSLVASLNLGADTMGCPGGDVQFTAPGGFNAYAWSNGAQSQTASLTVPGTYSCTITDIEGCIASDTVQVGMLTVDDDIITVNGHLPICIGDTVQLIGDGGLTGYQWSTGATSSSIFLTGQGGNIVLTAVEGQGCTVHDTVNVAFISVLGPEPVIVPGPAVTICQGSSVTLDAGGGYAFWDWSSGDTTQSVSISTAGTWSVTVENGFGCRGESDPVFVVVAPQPVVSLQDNAGTLVATSGFANYDWLLNGQPILPNFHGSSLVPTQSGSYQVIATDLNGCQDTSNAVVMTVVGTEAESSANIDVEIFPNPARDVLNLRAMTSIHGPVRIEIWDMLGQRLEVRELSNLTGIETFDLSHYAAASYMVRIQALKTGKVATIKFVRN